MEMKGRRRRAPRWTWKCTPSTCGVQHWHCNVMVTKCQMPSAGVVPSGRCWLRFGCTLPSLPLVVLLLQLIKASCANSCRQLVSQIRTFLGTDCAEASQDCLTELEQYGGMLAGVYAGDVFL